MATGRSWCCAGTNGAAGPSPKAKNVAELIGRLTHVLVVAPYDLGPAGDVVHDNRRQDGAGRMQRELERGDDTEVAAAAAHSPEQIGVLDSALARTLPSAVTIWRRSRLSHVIP